MRKDVWDEEARKETKIQQTKETLIYRIGDRIFVFVVFVV